MTGSCRFAWHLAHKLKEFQMAHGNLEEKVEALDILMSLEEQQGHSAQARAIKAEILSLLRG
jgi:hypothetical protein